ncbi:hypothetical protein Tsubulata_002174 [Turnera subulata]|uniref:CCHC-type domain-containing protein n=1 Tax=Turnera subulata TaxID=218843 RepID=A0A9Q0JAT7_9ROSI|nr:hypothetical protein Tsubulata_002174 [Turnera subulata]
MRMKPEGPSFKFSDKFKSHIACPWVFSVFMKALGQRFSYRVICSKVAFLWKPQGGFQVLDLDSDYFLVRFERKEDYYQVLAEGPSVIQGTYLTVRSWVPGQIGKPIRIDINTLQAERAKFARLAIEVDFSQPLLGWVEVEDCWFKVSYEDIPDFCFLCGTAGHQVESCTQGSTTSPSAPPVAVPAAASAG